MIRTPCRYETAKTESLTFIHPFVFRVVQDADLIVRAPPIQRLSICTSVCGRNVGTKCRGWVIMIFWSGCVSARFILTYTKCCTR